MESGVIKGMTGIVIGYRRGGNRQINKHMLLKFPNFDSDKKAAQLIGRIISWTSPGKKEKKLRGKIVKTHGRNGVVRAIFKKGLPGQAIGTEVKIVS